MRTDWPFSRNGSNFPALSEWRFDSPEVRKHRLVVEENGRDPS